jgi:hypothetical protein
MAVLATIPLSGDVSADGGDYQDVTFQCPVGTKEFQITHTTTPAAAILDYGVWSPAGFRGWSGGLLTPITIGVDQSSRSYLPGPIDFSQPWTISLGKALLIAPTADAPGAAHYDISIECRDAETLPVLAHASYTPVVLNPARAWYRGDFHTHSIQSGDATATLDQNYALAMKQGLDFINASDHNTIAQHALVAAAQPSLPNLLVMRGSEITTYTGHGNAVGISSYVDHRLGYQNRTIKGVIDDVVAQGGIFIVNHPATDLGTSCIGCGWKHMDDVPWDEVSGLEVLTANYSLGVVAFTPKVITMWDTLEDQGHRLSAVSGSDDHSAGVGDEGTGSPIGEPCSRVLADNLSEAAIMDGVRKHHTMVQMRGPTDPIVAVQMTNADGSMADIGDDVSNVSQVQMPVTVTGNGSTTYFLQVWRDGQKLATIGTQGNLPVDSEGFTTMLTDTPTAGDHRYRVELVDAGGSRVVVTSHFYVHALGDTGAGSGAGSGSSTGGGGGGCSTAGGGALAAMLPAFMLILRRRKRAA